MEARDSADRLPEVMVNVALPAGSVGIVSGRCRPLCAGIVKLVKQDGRPKKAQSPTDGQGPISWAIWAIGRTFLARFPSASLS